MTGVLLMKILENLDPEQLKMFQWHLCQDGHSFEPIPCGALKNKGKEETIDSIMAKWPNKAVSITEEVLRIMNLNSLADKLKNQSGGAGAAGHSSSPPSSAGPPHITNTARDNAIQCNPMFSGCSIGGGVTLHMPPNSKP